MSNTPEIFLPQNRSNGHKKASIAKVTQTNVPFTKNMTKLFGSEDFISEEFHS